MLWNDQASSCISKIGWSGVVKVDLIGFSRGIWLLWRKKEACIKMASDSNKMINALVKDKRKEWWLFTALYASPIASMRKKLWKALKEISSINTFPWLIASDFNEIGSSFEKFGVSATCPFDKSVNRLVRECGLIDLGVMGPKFTWSNGRTSSSLIRLD